jgi:hypothetical protein
MGYPRHTEKRTGVSVRVRVRVRVRGLETEETELRGMTEVGPRSTRQEPATPHLHPRDPVHVCVSVRLGVRVRVRVYPHSSMHASARGS